jgi:hypothetical protein
MTALASLVLAVTNPELKSSAVSIIVDFGFIAISPRVQSYRDNSVRFMILAADRAVENWPLAAMLISFLYGCPVVIGMTVRKQLDLGPSHLKHGDVRRQKTNSKK